MSKVRRHVIKKESFSVSKFTCSIELSVKRSADTVVENFILMGYNLSAVIPHLQKVHGMSFNEISSGIEHVRKVVNDPANDPFVGWEQYYEL
jgi:hypothetical protein